MLLLLFPFLGFVSNCFKKEMNVSLSDTLRRPQDSIQKERLTRVQGRLVHRRWSLSTAAAKEACPPIELRTHAYTLLFLLKCSCLGFSVVNQDQEPRKGYMNMPVRESRKHVTLHLPCISSQLHGYVVLVFGYVYPSKKMHFFFPLYLSHWKTTVKRKSKVKERTTLSEYRLRRKE